VSDFHAYNSVTFARDVSQSVWDNLTSFSQAEKPMRAEGRCSRLMGATFLDWLDETVSDPNAFPVIGVHLAVMFGGSHELLR
jgi:hypothetical protein